MFKFSFDFDPAEATTSYNRLISHQTIEDSADDDKKSPVYPCEELPFEPSKAAVSPDVTSTFTLAPDFTIDYLNHLALLDETFTEDIVTAEMNHSDLVPNQYEGGLKVWECTYDLGEFLIATEERKAEFAGKKVLDLGCGAGILGIESLLLGASCVHFQDYNKDVLTKLTMMNYELNCRSTTEGESETSANPDAQVKFFSGDWGSFTEKFSEKYDFILTSETIYSTKNYTKLLELFDQMLAPNGVVYLAAKTYYFGVGGGVHLFQDRINTDGRFRQELAWKCASGVNREILRITRKDTGTS